MRFRRKGIVRRTSNESQGPIEGYRDRAAHAKENTLANSPPAKSEAPPGWVYKMEVEAGPFS